MVASITEAVAAWSTFAAVLLSLGLSLVPVWWRWFKRPRLEWTVGRNEPHRLAIWEKDADLAGSDLRIRVTNKVGHRRAENVRAQLQAVWVYTPRDNNPKLWGNLEFDVTPLRWSSRRNDDATAQQATVIAGGNFDYTTFVHRDNHRHSLVVQDARIDDRRAMEEWHLFEYLFRVVITADGIGPQVAYVRVATEPNAVATVERAQAPDPGEVYTLGLFGLFGLRDPESPASP
jgi:hypothetical protein